MRFFHFPLRTHRVRLRAVAGDAESSFPLPRQLILVRDEDLAALHARQDALIGRRTAPEPRRDRVDLSRW